MSFTAFAISLSSQQGIASGLVTMLAKTVIDRKFNEGLEKPLSQVMGEINRQIGEEKGDIVFSPYLLRLAAEKGVHELTLRLYGTRMNGFGQLHLKPGEFVFGRRKAAKETGLSESTVSAYLNQLHDCGHVRRHVHAHEYSVVEVVKWGYYQGLEKSHVHDHVHDHVHEVDTIKEDKEEYKNKRHSLSNEREYRKAEKVEKVEQNDVPLNSYERWLMEQQND